MVIVHLLAIIPDLHYATVWYCRIVKVLASSSYDDTIKLYSEDGDDWSCFATLGSCLIQLDRVINHWFTPHCSMLIARSDNSQAN